MFKSFKLKRFEAKTKAPSAEEHRDRRGILWRESITKFRLVLNYSSAVWIAIGCTSMVRWLFDSIAANGISLILLEKVTGELY